jgi:hypothetical protein
MELRNSVTLIALRTAIGCAWGIARTAWALEALGERIECAVDRQAHGRRINPAAVLEPLIAKRYAA